MTRAPPLDMHCLKALLCCATLCLSGLLIGSGGDAHVCRWDKRVPQTHVVNKFFTPAAAAAHAIASATGAASQGGPLVIADFADNPGAGSYGDATNLLRALLEANCTSAAFASMRDPEAVQAAHSAGKGAWITSLAIGGKTDASFGGLPVVCTNVEVRVVFFGGIFFSAPA